MTKMKISYGGMPLCLLLVIGLASCVKDRQFGQPELGCESHLIVNATYGEVKYLYDYETVQIQDDLVIEGYVVSSDAAGNFFNVLHFQDRPKAPSEGLQIEIELRDSHLWYPVGSKIYIKLKGLYLGKSKGNFKLGGTFNSFGNLSVGRLPYTVLKEHLVLACEQGSVVVPQQLEIDSLKESSLNTLVVLKDVEVVAAELGMPFALEKVETLRRLNDCNDNEIALLNSGYADFQALPLPEGKGTISGILQKDNSNFYLVIRDLNDIQFTNGRCEDVIDEFTSSEIFISELADPNNNPDARFVELYNAGDTILNLKGWRLRRYTNENTEVSSTIDLTDFAIGPGGTLTISPNAIGFESVYGFVPDMAVGTNTAADSNGDDNLELVDPFGKTIDLFGVIGEDGSGTEHEFEDGRAIRKPEIQKANPVFNFSEWTIYNDTGAEGTINSPQNAPEDFTPGIHNSP
ncbi:MAG: DUF5689 domain-containing protein [Flavobacteriaceae bacterium]